MSAEETRFGEPIPGVTETKQSLVGPFGQWTESETRFELGGSSTYRVAMSAVSCNEPLFPLRVGLRFALKVTIENANSNTGGGGSHSSRSVADNSTVWEVLEGPIDHGELRSRYPSVTIGGTTADRWRVYRVRSTYQLTWRVLEVAEDARQAYKNSNKSGEMLFVEGPNTGVELEPTWLQPGWTVTITEP